MLQACENGSTYWTKALRVKKVQEELAEYEVEKCNFMDGCGCSIEEVKPDIAKGRPFDTVYIYDTHNLLEVGQRRSSLRYSVSREKKCLNCV